MTVSRPKSKAIRRLRKSLLSRGMKYLVALILLLGAIMLYLLSSASADTPTFARDLQLLLFFGVALVLGLMVLVGYQLLDLRRRLVAGLFGSKLTLRLVLLFSLVAVLPGALVYGEAEQAVDQRIRPIALEQHRSIVEAIEERDGARAESVAREHSRVARNNLMRARPDQERLSRVPGGALIRAR